MLIASPKARNSLLKPTLKPRDWYFIAEQPAPAPHLAHLEGRADLTLSVERETCGRYHQLSARAQLAFFDCPVCTSRRRIPASASGNQGLEQGDLSCEGWCYASTPNTRACVRNLERGTPVARSLSVKCDRQMSGNSLIRNSAALRLYSRPMPRALRWSQGGAIFIMSGVTL